MDRHLISKKPDFPHHAGINCRLQQLLFLGPKFIGKKHDFPKRNSLCFLLDAHSFKKRLFNKASWASLAPPTTPKMQFNLVLFVGISTFVLCRALFLLNNILDNCLGCKNERGCDCRWQEIALMPLKKLSWPQHSQANGFPFCHG